MIQFDFIEFSNMLGVVLNLAMLGVFVPYALNAWRSDVPYMEYKPAVAFSVYVVGLTITRLWSWLWVWQLNRGIWTGWMDAIPINPIGIAVTTVGATCILRVFSPKRWGTVVWVTSLVVALVASILLFEIDRR